MGGPGSSTPSVFDGPTWVGRAPGLGVVVAVAVVAWIVAAQSSSLSPLVAGVALGALVANVAPLPASLDTGIRFAASTILRFGVVSPEHR